MSTNKTIAKNTLFLYFRMLLTMGVGLFTSRLVLDALGVVDYGIYGLVGGIVTMFAFLNSAMSSATQRYLSFDIGKKDWDRLQKTFNVTLNIHIGIAVVIFILAETLGLWFVNTQLDIPAERMYAANWVYQFSIFAFVTNVVQVPYNALLFAREHMSVYAYVSILETLLKLGIVLYLVQAKGTDPLILYAVLTFAVAFVIRMIYKLYCKRHFKESVYQFHWDKAYYKELMSYSGWNLFGQSANILSNQGVSVLFNLFFGVAINATISIANQVNTAIFSFVSNFQVAFNPQITKTYAASQIQSHKSLILTTSKMSLIVMTILASPVLLFTGDILQIWLGNNLPEYVTQFVQIVLLYSLVDALSGPFWASAYAIGNVKNYNIGISLINFLTLPLIYYLLKLGVVPHTAFLVKLFISMAIQTFRYYYVNSKLKFTFVEFSPYLWRILLLYCFNVGVCLLSYQMSEFTWSSFFIGIFVLEFVLLMIILFILNKNERKFLRNFIQEKLK